MEKIRETIIVEGKYDINTIKQCIDAHIIETAGFGIFNDKEKQSLIKILAKKNGIVILTDSDGAGFVIRNKLRGMISEGVVKHAYIPEIEGKEKRKAVASKEGKLGVEGMESKVILEALRRAGATFVGKEQNDRGASVTKQDMYFYGLSGGEKSATLREKLAMSLGLPRLMSANALLAAINMIFTKEEFICAVQGLDK